VRRTAILLVSALIFPASAAGHVTISPPFIENGVASEIALTVPNERPPHATVAVSATLPAGVAIVSADAPDGWSASHDGASVTWSGGRIEGRDEIGLSLRILADVSAGTYTVAARQIYDDGAAVSWKSDLSVLPATGESISEERSWSAIVAVVVGIGVITGSLLLVRSLRRRSLQDP
jgi:uncharacterized protein YcnI